MCAQSTTSSSYRDHADKIRYYVCIITITRTGNYNLRPHCGACIIFHWRGDYKQSMAKKRHADNSHSKMHHHTSSQTHHVIVIRHVSLVLHVTTPPISTKVARVIRETAEHTERTHDMNIQKQIMTIILLRHIHPTNRLWHPP